MTRVSQLRATAALVFPLFLLESPATAQIFVDKDATGTGTGGSWLNAMTDLQPAINLAVSSQQPILVAEGVYLPTTGLWPDSATGSNPSETTFRLKSFSELHGGFLGGVSGSTNPDTPDGAFGATILDGDLGGGANAYHVIVADGEDTVNDISTPVLIDGFRIRNGRASGLLMHDRGAGILIVDEVDIDLEHLTINNNVAKAEGGGIWLHGQDEGDFVCKLSTIENNNAAKGGGLYIHITTWIADLVNVHFFGNGSDSGGVGGFPPVTVNGGGIYFAGESRLRATNCLIHNNIAETGGGIYYVPNPPSQEVVFDSYLKNCTITVNGATSTNANAAGGVQVEGGTLGQGPNPTHVLYVDNSVVWANSRSVTEVSGPISADLSVLPGPNQTGIPVYIRYSDLGARVEATPLGGPDGINVDAFSINLDPIFVNPAAYRFQLVPDPSNTSPCIDTGQSTLLDPDWRNVDEDTDFLEDIPWDFSRGPRVIDNPNIVGNSRLDMGAYEAPPPGP